MDILREIGFVTNYIIQTFLSILKYSSWQIALIVIVIMFKRQFGMFISNMTNLKAGGFEAPFGKELSNVERIVNRSNSAKFEKSVGNNYEYVDNANYRVINSFRLLENQLRRVFEKESGSKRLFPIRRLARELVRMGLLSEADGYAVVELSNLRNRVVHGDSDASGAEADRFEAMTKQIEKNLLESQDIEK